MKRFAFAVCLLFTAVPAFAERPMELRREKMSQALRQRLAMTADDERQWAIVTLLPPEATNAALRSMSFTAHQDSFVAETDHLIDEVTGPLSSPVRYRYHAAASFAAQLTPDEIAWLEDDPRVLAISEDGTKHPARVQGNALMKAAFLHARGGRGNGIAVAVIDDGIDWSHPELGGGTTFPNAVVVGGYDFPYSEVNGPTADPFPACANDDTCDTHGTAVAGIIAGRSQSSGAATGVAPLAKIIGLRAGSSAGYQDRHILASLEWVLTNRTTYNIRVVNVSLGNSTSYSSPCDNAPEAAAYKQMFTRFANANIAVVVSAGNENRTNGLSAPACHSQVISVGAVYDANVGPHSYGDPNDASTRPCSDATTAADRVTCYSNSANYLTILAPSHDARTTQAGLGAQHGSYFNQFGGTSASAPYAAGAIAALMSVDPSPSRTPAQYAQLLRSTGTPVTDPKSSFSIPRIDLERAHAALSGPTGTASFTVGTVTGNCNSLVDVPVTLSAVTGLTSIDLRVNFDAAKLTVETVTFGTLTNPWFTTGTGSFDAQTPGSVRVVMAGPALSGSGTVAVVRFRTGVTASGNVPLTMSNTLVNGAAATGNAGALNVSCASNVPKNNIYTAPAAARLSGTNSTFFVSDFRVINTGNGTAEADVYLLANRDNATAPSRPLTIGAGQSLELNDIVKNLFGIDSGGGALRFASSQPLLITSNLYTTNNVCPDKGGTFGQFIPGIGATNAGTRQRVGHLINNTAYRANLGIVNTTANAATVTITLKNGSGQTIGTRTESLGAFGWLQINRVFDTLGAGSSSNAYAEVTADRAIVAYASILDNKTGDAIFMTGQNY
ncbi:MAG TPA: S8 family serine peptidase [Thermoanaerobaculia bacterium]|nr:S8 family serine peptidase [Thermoanaerobaculia bacterium]